MVSKINWKNIKSFIQGYYRDFAMSFCPYLIREHIIEQFNYRCKEAKKCAINGSCYACGCTTPELFWADKPCGLTEIDDKDFRKKIAGRKTPCYGPMLNKKDWNEFKLKIKK